MNHFCRVTCTVDNIILFTAVIGLQCLFLLFLFTTSIALTHPVTCGANYPLQSHTTKLHATLVLSRPEEKGEERRKKNEDRGRIEIWRAYSFFFLFDKVNTSPCNRDTNICKTNDKQCHDYVALSYEIYSLYQPIYPISLLTYLPLS